jgi:hypothetical protein
VLRGGWRWNRSERRRLTIEPSSPHLANVTATTCVPLVPTPPPDLVNTTATTHTQVSVGEGEREVVQESGAGRSGGRSEGEEWRRGAVKEETVNKYLQLHVGKEEQRRRPPWPRRRGTMVPRRWD